MENMLMSLDTAEVSAIAAAVVAVLAAVTTMSVAIIHALHNQAMTNLLRGPTPPKQ